MKGFQNHMGFAMLRASGEECARFEMFHWPEVVQNGNLPIHVGPLRAGGRTYQVIQSQEWCLNRTTGAGFPLMPISVH